MSSEAIPTRGRSRPQLPAASHLRGVLAVLSSAARIAMKFPVCASPLSLRGCSERAVAPQRPPLPGHPAAMWTASPRTGLLLAALCLLASHGKLQLAFLCSLPGETLLTGALPACPGLCFGTRNLGCLGRYLLSSSL